MPIYLARHSSTCVLLNISVLYARIIDIDVNEICSNLYFQRHCLLYVCLTGTLALGTSIDISGTGFSGSTSDNNVTIAGVPCTVTAATTSSITCDVGNGPVGAYDVIVNVAGNGDAAISGNVEFTYTANISSISPTSGSLGGLL